MNSGSVLRGICDEVAVEFWVGVIDRIVAGRGTDLGGNALAEYQ